MKFTAKLRNTASRLLITLRAARQLWKAGGICQVNIASLSHNESLKGRRILITGGSAGIGFAIAKKCIAEGASVVITGRDPGKLENALAKLDHPRAFSLSWDVADIANHEHYLDEASSLLGGEINALVNNAGILGGYGDLLKLDEETWDRIQLVNSKSLVFLTKQIVNRWLGLKQHGKILNISSMRGTLGVKDGPYGMSKWALNGLTQGLGLTLAPQGISVNGIAPGIIATDSISIKGVEPAENAYLKSVPNGRIGLPEEIAELAVFLLSDAANYIVGQTIVCDGGYTLHN